LCCRCSRRRAPGAADKGRDDRKLLEALHYFAVHNITWRALPAEFGNWKSVWKRFGG
jgi:transposase